MFNRPMTVVVSGLLMFVLTAVAAAAQDAVSLRGEVSGVKIIEENPQSLLIRLDLDLTLRNDSAGNAILYWHDFGLVGTLIFRRDENQYMVVLQRSSTSPSVDLSPEWAALRKRMDLKNPPADLTRTLKSGESISLKRTTNLRIFKKALYEASWDEIRAASPVWLQVDLDMFPSNLDQTTRYRASFGKKMLRKWRRFGVLQLGLLQSEPMRLDLGNL